jgi:hypothetical protein
MNARTVTPKTHVPRTLPLYKNERNTERKPTCCRVGYTYQVGEATYTVDGLTRDISKFGCGIRGAIIPPMRSKTRLTLYLPNQRLPLFLDARVIWVAGDYFGVQFPEMRKEDYMRVRRFMWTVLNG